MAEPLKMGERFEVSVQHECRDANGALLARLLPGLGYKMTPRNKPFIDPLVEAGIATRLAPGGRGDTPFNVGAGPSSVSGTINTDKPKKAGGKSK